MGFSNLGLSGYFLGLNVDAFKPSWVLGGNVFFFLPESRLRLINIIALYRSGTLVSQRWILEFVIILD